jgi:hypothetical protein
MPTTEPSTEASEVSREQAQVQVVAGLQRYREVLGLRVQAPAEKGRPQRWHHLSVQRRFWLVEGAARVRCQRGEEVSCVWLRNGTVPEFAALRGAFSQDRDRRGSQDGYQGSVEDAQGLGKVN